MGEAIVNASANHATQKNIIIILDRGAKPNIGEKEGWNSLHWAATNGNRDIMQLLLEREANLIALTKDRLHYMMLQ